MIKRHYDLIAIMLKYVRGTAAWSSEFNRIGVIKSHFYTIFFSVGSRGNSK